MNFCSTPKGAPRLSTAKALTEPGADEGREALSTPERHERLSELVLEALRLGGPQRERFLRERAEEDEELAAEARDLLASHGEGGPLESALCAKSPVASASRFVSHRLRAGTIIEDFELVELLGRGGMGEVWLAHKTSTGGAVALKVVSPGCVGREVRAAGHLRHPGIVQVHQTGSGESFGWISMEYVEGGRTLRDLVRECREAHEHGVLPRGHERRVAELIAAVADALQAAHDAGVIHRDVKPGNILLTPRGAPKVADFGVARRVDDTDKTKTGENFRTPSYCSPEQATADAGTIDQRTDVFSVGAVLYELLALRRPFEGDSAAQVERKILHEEPADPRTIRSRVPRDLAVICGKCLEKAPGHRYSSMKNLAADLGRFLEHRPIVARPPGLSRRALLWARRNPRVVAGIVLVAVLCLGLAGTVVGFVRARAENRRFRLTRYAIELEYAVAEADALHPDPETWRVGWSDLQGQLRHWLRERADRLEAQRLEVETAVVGLTSKVASAMTDRLSEGATVSRELAQARRKLQSWERAIAIAGGRATLECPGLEEAVLGLPHDELHAFAGARTSPDNADRIWGEEALALTAARRVVDELSGKMFTSGWKKAASKDSLAWALAWNGQLDEARHAGREALELLDGAPDYAKTLARLEAFCEELAAGGDRGLQDAEREVARLEIEERRARIAEWVFEDPAESFLLRTMLDLLGAMHDFVDPVSGTVSDVRRRLAWAERVRELTARPTDNRPTWEDARFAIATADGQLASELYAACPVDLVPQEGLVPIGKNPVTGLWEFYHLRSAWEAHEDSSPASLPIPEHDPASGQVEVTPRSGIVFVLVPGGTFDVGTVWLFDNEPVQSVSLDPFFIARHELTQAQWLRLSGDGANPSALLPGEKFFGMREPADATHPVEQVSWWSAEALLRSHGLLLPTETQWEVAARAGTEPSWRKVTLQGFANLLDASARAIQVPGDPVSWDDGYPIHAPVGSFPPNAWGLYDVHGNVAEWCRDWYADYDEVPARPADGLRVVDDSQGQNKINRGGSFRGGEDEAKPGFRIMNTPTSRYNVIGLRASRILVR